VHGYTREASVANSVMCFSGAEVANLVLQRRWVSPGYVAKSASTVCGGEAGTVCSGVIYGRSKLDAMNSSLVCIMCFHVSSVSPCSLRNARACSGPSNEAATLASHNR